MKSTLSEKHLSLVYALLEYGPQKSGKLSHRTKIPTSHIYSLLEELEELGLVAKSLENNATLFFATSTQALKRVLEEEKQELNKKYERAEELEKISIKTLENDNSVRVFKGIPAIKGMWDLFNKEMTADTEIKLYTAKKEAYQHLIGFYDEHHRIREELGAKEQLLVDHNDEQAKKRANVKNTQVKTLQLNNEAEWGIQGKYAFFQHITTKEPTALLIENELMVKTLNQVYDQLWVIAKD